MVAQPVVRRFVIDVEQLYGFMVLAGQRIQMLAERVSAVFSTINFNSISCAIALYFCVRHRRVDEGELPRHLFVST